MSESHMNDHQPQTQAIHPHANRYHYSKEGWRYVIRCGTGVRPIFKAWRKITAMRLVSELQCAFFDGDFMRRDPK